MSSLFPVLLVVLAILQAVSGAIRKYTLTVTREEVGQQGQRVAINHQTPGPALFGQVGDTFEVTVINGIAAGNESTTIHWHGLDQRGTPFSDGVIGITQCPIAPGQSMLYRFVVDRPGTYWYHGHVHEQYIDGLVGPLIVTRPKEQQYFASLGAPYAHDDWTLSIADFYQNKGSDYLPWYISPASGGDEPSLSMASSQTN